MGVLLASSQNPPDIHITSSSNELEKTSPKTHIPDTFRIFQPGEGVRIQRTFYEATAIWETDVENSWGNPPQNLFGNERDLPQKAREITKLAQPS